MDLWTGGTADETWESGHRRHAAVFRSPRMQEDGSPTQYDRLSQQ